MKMMWRMLQMSVTCADISRLLFDMNIRGIGIRYVQWIDELTAVFCIRQSQFRHAVMVIEQAGGVVDKVIPAPEGRLLKGALRRPVLILGIILILVLSIFLPSRVLFVSVSGNERIPSQQIWSVAADSGLYFGAQRQAIRSEKVKNQVLSALPELKWVGVNTTGCVAHITVCERATVEMKKDSSPVSSLIASCDGVIRNMTVTAGTSMCQVGQAVTKGQLLVSGYSDCGRCIYGTRAEAEIYAQTRRVLKLSTLTDGLKKVALTDITRKYGLLIGKKRINFYKGSGICDTTCVRMYMEYPLTLPGGYQLPLALTVQKELGFDTAIPKEEQSQKHLFLEQAGQAYLDSQMIAGKIEQGNYQFEESGGALHLIGEYICGEMIGQNRNEEIIKDYEQTD